MKFRDLFSKEVKGVLFQFSIDDKISSILKFTSALVYTDVTDGRQKTVTNVNNLSPIRNLDAYLTYFNKQVIEQVVLSTANENLERAMVQVDGGDYSGAQKTLFLNSSYLRANAAYSGSYDFKKLDSVNRSYSQAVANVKNLSADSVKRIQKSGKAENYKIRNKKQ